MYFCENKLNWFMFKDKASKARLTKTKVTHRSGQKGLKALITTFVSILNMWYFFNKICTRRKPLLSNFSLFTDWQELKYGWPPNHLEKEVLQQKRWVEFVVWMDSMVCNLSWISNILLNRIFILFFSAIRYYILPHFMVNIV